MIYFSCYFFFNLVCRLLLIWSMYKISCIEKSLNPINFFPRSCHETFLCVDFFLWTSLKSNGVRLPFNFVSLSVIFKILFSLFFSFKKKFECVNRTDTDLVDGTVRTPAPRLICRGPIWITFLIMVPTGNLMETGSTRDYRVSDK